ncbi:hypothetical protein SAMN05216534_1214 [Candidatus Aquiluna sp. UB-MaderosW2red]|nr:hypothetical protein SAMN05216534_1214 [Candidatus Aquiluna sp. UB-MaderosW2red]
MAMDDSTATFYWLSLFSSRNPELPD